mgnify:CR=1 FL=1
MFAFVETVIFTGAEYIDLIDTGLDKIESECKTNKYNYSCLIAHSAGATAIIEMYNKRISDRKKLRFSASVLFAPYLCDEFVTYIKNFYKHRYFTPETPDEEFNNKAIGISSPHEPRPDGKFTYISVLPNIFDDVKQSEFKPELMDRYNIPITLVAGGRDRKSPPEELRKKYNILKNRNKMQKNKEKNARKSKNRRSICPMTDACVKLSFLILEKSSER